MDTTALFAQAVDKFIATDTDQSHQEFLSNLKTISANPKAVSFILENPTKIESVISLLLPSKRDRSAGEQLSSEYTSGSKAGFNVCRTEVLSNLSILKSIIEDCKQLDGMNDVTISTVFLDMDLVADAAVGVKEAVA